jgi:FKBP-type peptidyl-prolyl cis-trans isomerase SlyD
MKKLLGLLVISGAVLGALFFLTTMAGSGAGQPAQSVKLTTGQAVKDGSLVSIEYTLTDDSGKVLDTNVGKEPLTYIQGGGQIVPGLEKELTGLKVGDEKKVTVKPEEGYGAVDAKLFQELPKENFPPEALKAGAMLMVKSKEGGTHPIRVAEVKEKTVLVDLNHPLAGKTLKFDVKVKDIKEASTN